MLAWWTAFKAAGPAIAFVKKLSKPMVFGKKQVLLVFANPQ